MSTGLVTIDKQAAELRKRYEANRAAAEKALREATKKPTVQGSTGQPKPNPLFAVAERHDTLALQFHRELVTLIRDGKVSDALERARRNSR